MDQSSSKLFTEASQLLDEYYRAIITKIADEIVDNRDTFDSPYTGRAEEIVDRYGLHLQSLNILRSEMMSMAQFLAERDRGEAPAPPVAPSGLPVDSETPLAPGANVLAEWGGGWWRASVVAVEPEGDVLIHYVGWGDQWNERVPRSRLRTEADSSME